MLKRNNIYNKPGSLLFIKIVNKYFKKRTHEQVEMFSLNPAFLRVSIKPISKTQMQQFDKFGFYDSYPEWEYIPFGDICFC